MQYWIFIRLQKKNKSNLKTKQELLYNIPVLPSLPKKPRRKPKGCIHYRTNKKIFSTKNYVLISLLEPYFRQIFVYGQKIHYIFCHFVHNRLDILNLHSFTHDFVSKTIKEINNLVTNGVWRATSSKMKITFFFKLQNSTRYVKKCF